MINRHFLNWGIAVKQTFPRFNLAGSHSYRCSWHFLWLVSDEIEYIRSRTISIQFSRPRSYYCKKINLFVKLGINMRDYNPILLNILGRRLHLTILIKYSMQLMNASNVNVKTLLNKKICLINQNTQKLLSDNWGLQQIVLFYSVRFLSNKPCNGLSR